MKRKNQKGNSEVVLLHANKNKGTKNKTNRENKKGNMTQYISVHVVPCVNFHPHQLFLDLP